MGIFKFIFKKKDRISKKAIIHSTIGEFTKNNRLISGGHSQKNLKELKKRGIKYNIEKIYSNGVRLGNIPSHKNKLKQSGINQTWFPKSWNDKVIKHAAQFVAKRNKKIDNQVKDGYYKKVNVGIIRTNGKISTIFPMNIQKNKKGVELNERKKITRTNKKK